jgi:FlaA1/EpsC-like NDP-sugar epimerase
MSRCFEVWLFVIMYFSLTMITTAFQGTKLKTAKILTRPLAATKISEGHSNTVCLVTGASRGIGKATALSLGTSGCKVIVNYSSNEKAALQVCDEINSTGGTSIALKANCADPADVSKLFQQVVEKV